MPGDDYVLFMKNLNTIKDYLPSKTKLASAFLGVFAVVLVSSENSFKKLVSGWFDECSIVVDIASPRLGRSKNGDMASIVNVELYALGDMPQAIDLSFSTGAEPLIEQVKFERDYTGDNLAMHPLSGRRCPGDAVLCGSVSPPSDSDRKSDVHIDLKHFHRLFAYQFAVTLARSPEELGDDDLGVYVLYQTPIEETVCRVERSSLSNIYVWVGQNTRLLLSAVIVVLLTLIVLKLKEWGKEK